METKVTLGDDTGFDVVELAVEEERLADETGMRLNIETIGVEFWTR